MSKDTFSVIDANATKMADVYQRHSEFVEEFNQHLVSEEGMKELAELYEALPVEQLAATAEVFMSKLQERGLVPVIDQVQDATIH